MVAGSRLAAPVGNCDRRASRRVVAILRGAHFFGSRRAREPAAAAAAKLFRL